MNKKNKITHTQKWILWIGNSTSWYKDVYWNIVGIKEKIRNDQNVQGQRPGWIRYDISHTMDSKPELKGRSGPTCIRMDRT